jgi:DNA replication protein DnaC
MATKTKPTTDSASLCRALKAPSLARSVERLAERARTESWTHEEFLAACLEREVAARQDHGGEGRIRAARFPARKTLEDVDFSFQRSLKRDVIAHLGALDFIAERADVVFQLVSSRYERASVIVTSNKPFGRWGETFGDATVATAMIDRLVHHAEAISLKGDSYRLKDRDLGTVPHDDAD